MYFQFGDVVGHDAEHCTHDDSFPAVEVDGNNYLLPAYDAATQLMGEGYRMPTMAEMDELVNNTDHAVETINGVKGMKFTSKTDSSKYIFIPFAGVCVGDYFVGVGDEGELWSSTLDVYDDFFADQL